MAQKRTVTLLSDVSGVEADETLTFGLDGKTYDIDLTGIEADEVREFLAPYVSVARKHASGTNRRRTSAPAKSRQPPAVSHNPSQMRAWARDNGVQVPARGRIPTTVREQFAAARGFPQ